MAAVGAAKETFVYKTVDGLRIVADVYRAGPAAPVLIWIHGGGLIFGSRGDLPAYQLERYLRAGLTVVSIDYRLAPETRLAGIIEDVRDAYAWVVAEGPERFGLTDNRVAVLGHSGGGYLAMMSGFGVAPRPKAIVSFYGYGDIAGDWYSKPSSHYAEQPAVPEVEARAAVGDVAVASGPFDPRFRFYLRCRQTGTWPEEVTGHSPERDAAWFNAYCPERNVTAEYPSTLLIHGTADDDVPYEQSPAMARALAAHGVRHQLMSLSGIGHAFDLGDGTAQSPEIAAIFDRAIAFLRAELG